MQGELGTSHAYEMGGDYRAAPSYPQGFLGADFEWDANAGAYQIRRVVQGTPGDAGSDSPLNAPGVNVHTGDHLLAINGRRLNQDILPQELLVNTADADVILTIRSGEAARDVTVRTLRSEAPARYREWVETNRRTVHEATGGRIGYVHIPDMGPRGYAEFHRLYLSEVERDGLIVDVRNNGGGHVSQLIIEKLARRRVGYDVQRWGVPEPYPSHSVAGPMVAICNQWAGSDGDIFSHVFKLMNLGPLIGKRTWGGVIGISPRTTLVDGSITTQPEFSFWFKDVGWGVENYGTDPDIDVDIAPQDYARGDDPQLERAISVVLERLEAEPVLKPSFENRPNLAPPPIISPLEE
jgi:tricorn protease